MLLVQQKENKQEYLKKVRTSFPTATYLLPALPESLMMSNRPAQHPAGEARNGIR